MGNEEAKKLAAHLARKLFEIGDDGPERRAVRLQYKTGSLTNERDGGGLIESSLAGFLEHELRRYYPAQETAVTPQCKGQYPGIFGPMPCKRSEGHAGTCGPV